MDSKHDSIKTTPLFGYFYKESNGSEVILVNRPSSDKWGFPINTVFDLSSQRVTEAVDEAILRFCQTNSCLEPIDFIESGLESPSIRKILLGPSPSDRLATPEGREGYFFKARLHQNCNKLSNEHLWKPKIELFQDPENCIHPIELSAISRNFIYTQYGFRILECVDVLVFRIASKSIEFLMLKREDRVRGFVGWEYPKGGILFHETINEGALHRLREETGVSSYVYRGYLGFQTVDVSDRKLAEYNALKVHGLTFEFIGNDAEIRPVDPREIMRNPTWVSWERAKEMVWMKKYGPIFFDRWKSQENDILSNASTYDSPD